MRLIDADAILGDLHERLDFLLSEYGEFDAYYCGFEEAVERIENVPTVDAEPVRHGEWKRGESLTFAGRTASPPYCSECLRFAGGELWTFCPNCGAKMDGDPI